VNALLRRVSKQPAGERRRELTHKQAPDFRLRRAEDGLPDIGARSGQAPDPNAVVGEQSLSSKLLDYQPSNGAQPAPVEKRETNPLKGVY